MTINANDYFSFEVCQRCCNLLLRSDFSFCVEYLKPLLGSIVLHSSISETHPTRTLYSGSCEEGPSILDIEQTLVGLALFGKHFIRF
jgi:hypothetical protein